MSLDAAFSEAGLCIRAEEILRSEPTDGREILYSLKASAQWIHVP
jgi:hypothetical protein